MALFDIRTPWQPTADQPKAITQLLDGLQKGMRYQTLLSLMRSPNIKSLPLYLHTTKP
jgi:excinuclease UvrABC helicase subunit UvrB